MDARDSIRATDCTRRIENGVERVVDSYEKLASLPHPSPPLARVGGEARQLIGYCDRILQWLDGFAPHVESEKDRSA